MRSDAAPRAPLAAGRANILLLLVSIFACIGVLGIVEFVARRHYRLDLAEARQEAQQRALRIRERYPNSSFTLELEATEGVRSAGMRHGAYVLETDSLGFIRPSGNLGPGFKRLLFLGGSTTECAFVDAESRFPYLVARLLTDSLGVQASAFNAGRSGNNTMHSLINLIGKGTDIQPDVVIAMENINDVVRLAYFGTYGGIGSADDERAPMILRREPPDSRSAVAALVVNLVPGMSLAARRFGRRLAGSEADEFAGRASGHISIDTAAIAGAYRSKLRALIGVARAHGAVPVLMTQPSRFPPVLDEHSELGQFWARNRQGIDYREFVAAHAYLNEVVRGLAGREGVVLIDLAREFTPSATNMYDVVHVTAEGSREEARIIARRLLEAVFDSSRQASVGRVASEVAD